MMDMRLRLTLQEVTQAILYWISKYYLEVAGGCYMERVLIMYPSGVSWCLLGSRECSASM